METKIMQSPYNYDNAVIRLENKGIELYGKHFKVFEADKDLLRKLLCYFLRDTSVASQLNVNLDKGILLTGPVGCGKTTLMSLSRFFEPTQSRLIIKSCREISFEFITEGYEIIHKYSRHSFQQHTHIPKTYCFDDLGVENNLKYYGNECNVMGEILLSRYDLFVSRKLVTHLTTNLSASEIEAAYGNRIRSRMREMFNLLAFDKNIKDKRV